MQSSWAKSTQSYGKLPGVLLVLCIQLLIVAPGYAALCENWDEPRESGDLNTRHIKEASGIAVSRNYPGRLYHVNDSGGGPYFYTTGLDGSGTKKVKIEGVNYNNYRTDYEDLTLGPCGSEKSCLIIADIGDNREKRDHVELIFIEEKKSYESSVSPDSIIKLLYPDRAHNAEGVAVHPNGDIYVLTKEENLNKMDAYPSRLYRAPFQKFKNSNREPVLLEYIAEIDLGMLMPESSVFGKLATSFDISPDGKRFLVLTYEDAIEFNHDLSMGKLKNTGDMKENEDYKIIELISLPQQESAAYLDDSGFIYNTELKLFSVPLMTVKCLDKR